MDSLPKKARRGRVPGSREQRGVALAQERFEGIERVAPWTWSVPSSTEADKSYVVNLKHEACSCPDTPPKGGVCKHVTAAAYVKARTGVCANCGGRFRGRDLIEVMDSHESLTWFEGDEVCVDCAPGCGLL